MKILFYLSCIFLLQCTVHKERKTPNMELRQLVKTKDTVKSSYAFYFLIVGGYSSSEKEETKVEVFANTGKYYKYFSFDIEDVRVNIDDSVKQPYINLVYNNFRNLDIEQIHYYNYVIITTPSIYLPEKLLPVVL